MAVSKDEPEYASDHRRVLEHPEIKAILARLRAMTPPRERPTWALNARAFEYGLRNFPESRGGARYARDVLRWNVEGWPVTDTDEFKCGGTEVEYTAKVRHIIEGLRKMEKRALKNYMWGPFATLEDVPFAAEGRDKIAIWPMFYKEESDKVRLLVNMSSRDMGESLNDQLAQSDKTVKYLTIKNVIQLLTACNLRWIWCMDAYEAYYRVPVESKMIPLLGIRICGFYFFFTCLVMGLAASCKIYTEFGDVICWIIINQYPLIFKQWRLGREYELLHHYIDDFFSGHGIRAIAILQFEFVRYWWKLLGIPTQDRKCTPPTTHLRFLGYIFHTTRRTAFCRSSVGCLSIPLDRLEKYIAGLKDDVCRFQARQRMTVRSLQRVVGQIRSMQLVFPYTVPLLRRLEKITSTERDNRKWEYVTGGIVEDIEAIVLILQDSRRNAMSFDWILNRGTLGYRYDITVYTDASTSVGMGGYIDAPDGQFFQCAWSETHMKYFLRCDKHGADIMYYEMLAVVTAAQLFGAQWRGKTVHFYCDNEAVCYCVARKCACFRRLDLNGLLRVLCRLARVHGFLFWIDHVAGEANVVADALSRVMGSASREQQLMGVRLAKSATKSVDVANELLMTFLMHASEMRRWTGTKVCECDGRSLFVQLCCKAQDEVFKLL